MFQLLAREDQFVRDIRDILAGADQELRKFKKSLDIRNSEYSVHEHYK